MPEIEPHPDRDERDEPRTRGRGEVIVALAIGGILLIVVALHLLGSTPHGP